MLHEAHPVYILGTNSVVPAGPSWSQQTWIGFYLWMQKRRQRSGSDAANRAKKVLDQARATDRSSSRAASVVTSESTSSVWMATVVDLTTSRARAKAPTKAALKS